MQFEDSSDARLSDEEARRKIMQRTLTGVALCAHLACMLQLGALISTCAPWNHNRAAFGILLIS